MRFRGIAVFVSVAALLALGQADASAAAPLPKDDSFYRYSGSAASLAAMKPGTVILSRPVAFHLASIPTALTGEQLLYRTTTQLGKPTVTVASVIQPVAPIFPKPRLVSDQFAYDALDGVCDPSYFISGGVNTAGGTTLAEQVSMAGLLTQGYTVVTPDYEGEDLAWTAPQQSGDQTLDGIRAALHSTAHPLPSDTKVGMIGYSGGAIATEWAAELAPKYAPDLIHNLIGTAIGGIYSDPAHNLRYVDGTPLWSGVEPGALAGVSRGFGIAIDKYASTYGKQMFDYAKDKCIGSLLGHAPGLTFAKLVQPQYADISNVRTFVQILNKSIMSTGGTPSTPLLMAQGLGGEIDGTPGNTPGIGAGDGVMVAGDNRTLARTYCARGLSVDYSEYPGEHISTTANFLSSATPWLADRFAGKVPAPSDCSTIAPGNSLAPLPTPASTTVTKHSTSSAKHTTVTHSTASSAGTNALADTGPQQTQRLLLWAALLLCLGSGLLVAARRPRALLAVTAALPRRPLPGPTTAARRPLPYSRD